jgi:ABC-type phosphate transport system ATPase subunit
MSFKENLLKKIKINNMAKQVIASIGPVDSGRKIDKKIMRNLLDLSDYTYKRKRDLDLYIEDIDAEKTRILTWSSAKRRTLLRPFNRNASPN